MRTFILYARKARTDPNFNVDDLPSSGGRMDLVCRCISSTIFVSRTVRDDTRIFIILNGPPKPPVTICFDGIDLSGIAPDERSIAMWIKKALSLDFGKKWKRMHNGIKISKKSFRDIIKEEVRSSRVYVLNEKGESISDVKFTKDVTIVIGDQKGIPPEEEKFALRHGERISLGEQSYLASSCISVLNWFFDKKNI